MRHIIILFLCLWISASSLASNLSASPKNDPSNLTLHFKEIPARDLLTLLAQIKQRNLILSGAVQGNVTVHLDNVTWNQALDSVLSMQGLGMRQDGNILLIAPINEILSRETQDISAEKLGTAFVRLHYAKAADLSALLQSKTDNLLSSRGSVAADERTNQLWIKDTPERLAQVRQFLKGIDLPAKQVQIAARIVNVDESSVQELGVRFSTSSGDVVTAAADALQMDMPISVSRAGNFSMAIAKLGQGNMLDLEIAALEREGRAHIVSSPQLITSNRQPAAIESGQEIPYQEKTSSGATNTAFKKAVLSLKVTPEITPENKILLSVVVNQDKIDKLQVNGVPAISTQQVQSQILLNDGETIVLGGIYEQSNDDLVERVPFFGKLPVVGKLFSRKETQVDRKELLVFITPRMIK